MKYTLAAICAFLTSLHAQPLGDTIIEGNLNVEVTNGGTKGNLIVDGETKLSQSPASMSQEVKDAVDVTQADYYGPVQTGPRNHRIEFVFSRADLTDLNYTGLPIGYIMGATRAKVHATVWHLGSGESASWDVRGSRHRTLKCLRHEAYGNASHFKLRGTRTHGHMFMLLDFDGTGLSGEISWIKVTLEVEGEHATIPVIRTGILSVPPESYGNHTVDIEILNSTVYHKVLGQRGVQERGQLLEAVTQWNGTKFEIAGQVVLKQPQGDISMGIYGN